MLVTGGSGFLGHHLVRGRASADWQIVAPTSRSMDITDRQTTIDTIADCTARRGRPPRVPQGRAAGHRRRHPSRRRGGSGGSGAADPHVDRRRLRWTAGALRRNGHARPDHRLRTGEDPGRGRGPRRRPRRSDHQDVAPLRHRPPVAVPDRTRHRAALRQLADDVLHRRVPLPGPCRRRGERHRAHRRAQTISTGSCTSPGRRRSPASTSLPRWLDTLASGASRSRPRRSPSRG